MARDPDWRWPAASALIASQQQAGLNQGAPLSIKKSEGEKLREGS